jgi:hypothetical protein
MQKVDASDPAGLKYAAIKIQIILSKGLAVSCTQ